MQQFLMLAAVHFLALLSPGPDFFLVARTSLSAGWRVASGVCLGIALANGVFIVIALGGSTVLRPDRGLFMLLQGMGAVYLLYLGSLFIRHAGRSGLRVPAPVGQGRPGWGRAAGMGFLSGILNPKNGLFYASLAAMLEASSAGSRLWYGLWMFSVVLGWDVLVAVLIGNPVVLGRFARGLPWLERLSGGVLILLALGVLLSLIRGDG
jgi:threonine/homoserine/homoserine lactone efflux protein